MTNPLRNVAAEPRHERSAQEVCDAANARRLSDPKGRRDVHWYAHGDEWKIGWHPNYVAPPRPAHIIERDRRGFTADDWNELNIYLASRGSPVRYRSDGSREAA